MDYSGASISGLRMKRSRAILVLAALALTALGNSGQLQELAVEAKPVHSTLKDFGRRLRNKLEHIGVLRNEGCKRKLKRGEIPSAADGDAPLETFGYPTFNQTSATVSLHAQVSLSNIGGHPQPIRVGANDWVAQGSVEDVLRLFFCFGQYKVIGEKLQQDGSWRSEGDVGPLYLQVQNVRKYQGSSANILLIYMAEKTLEMVDVYSRLGSRVKKVLAGMQLAKKKAEELRTILEGFSSNSPLAKRHKSKASVEAYNAKGPPTAAEASSVEGEWVNARAVDAKENITVYLTSYSSTSSTMATYAFASNVVTLEDVASALALLTYNSKVKSLFLDDTIFGMLD